MFLCCPCLQKGKQRCIVALPHAVVGNKIKCAAFAGHVVGEAQGLPGQSHAACFRHAEHFVETMVHLFDAMLANVQHHFFPGSFVAALQLQVIVGDDEPPAVAVQGQQKGSVRRQPVEPAACLYVFFKKPDGGGLRHHNGNVR